MQAIDVRELTATTELAADRFYGKYRGTVTNVNDPQHAGRVKMKVPDVLGKVETGWALPCTPYAGPATGLYLIPPVDAAVWAEFEAGDVSRPIWSGGWWGPDEAPGAPSSSTPLPGRREVRSETGLTVSLDDEAGELLVSDGNGKNLIRIRVPAGQLEITAAAQVTIEAPRIRHGQQAAEPAVLGRQLDAYLNQLVTLFNTHLHPGQFVGSTPVTPAPPVGPFIPPPPSMLSMKNSVE